MRGMAYHQILNELLGDLKPLGVIRISELLEAQSSPLSSPPPGAPKSRQLAEVFWRRKERGGGPAGWGWSFLTFINREHVGWSEGGAWDCWVNRMGRERERCFYILVYSRSRRLFNGDERERHLKEVASKGKCADHGHPLSHSHGRRLCGSLALLTKVLPSFTQVFLICGSASRRSFENPCWDLSLISSSH